MKNINKVYLKDIETSLDNCLVRINHKFLKKMILDAAKNDKPYKDVAFLSKIDLFFNEKSKIAVGLYNLIKKNRSIKFLTLKRIKNLTNYSWSDIEQNLISIRPGRRNGEAYIKFPIEINQNLGSVVGHILGDGSIDKRYLQITYNNKNKDLIFEFHNYMKNVFNISPRIWIQKSGKFKEKNRWVERLASIDKIPQDTQITLFYPSICGLVLHSIFGKFAFGEKKQITKKIFDSSPSFKIGLIRAFFDDEGHLDKERGPRFYQSNKSILLDLKSILEEFGIDTCPTRKYIKKGKFAYFFNINSRKNYLLYYQIIGCTSKKKRESLENLISKTNKINIAGKK